MTQFLLVVLVLHLAACGASSSKSTGPSQNCDVTFAQKLKRLFLPEEDTQTSAAANSSVGNTTFQCGPQDSPNRTKTITIPGEETP